MSAPGMTWPTTLWLAATGGQADRGRIALTAVGSAVGTLALTSAVAVVAIGPGDGPYTSDLLNQPGLHLGLVVALVLLCIPVLTFVGQCARIGAPARDRRLASLRLQGATPGDVVRIAAVETGLSAALGATVGIGLFFILRALLGDPVSATYDVLHTTTVENGSTQIIVEEVTGPALRLPTDAMPPWPALLAVAVLIPLAAALFTTVALRRVAITPFGVARSEQHQPARILPVAFFLGGTAGMAAFATLQRLLHLENRAPFLTALVFFGLFLVTGVGVLSSTSALSAGIGSFLAARTRRPSLLLAGRRLTAAPHQVSRANAALLLIVMVWAFTQGYRAQMLANVDPTDAGFYAEVLDLVSVGFAVGAGIAAASLLIGMIEGVVSRRRTLAAMTAVGIPRTVLRRAVVTEAMLPLVPAVVLAAAAGVLGARGMLGTTAKRGVLDADGVVNTITLDVPVPWAAVGILVGATLLAALAAAVATLPLLQRSLQPGELRTP